MTPRFSVFKILLLASLAATGCASHSTTPVAAEPDLVGVRIAHAAERASVALDTISGIEQQRTPLQVPSEDYAALPPALTQPVTIRWTGPIEQITQMLAARAGLQFHALGSPPPVPITVAVDVYQEPLIDILRSIGLQADRRADIHLDGYSGMIELRYAPVDRL
jgi:defect-in-organelle-trafficking protein DotD